MDEFFHVSCVSGRFPTPPKTLELDKDCLELPQYGAHPTKEEFIKLVKEYYPDGLSHFGKDYLMESVRYKNFDNYGYISNVMSIDAYFEFVRRFRFRTDLPAISLFSLTKHSMKPERSMRLRQPERVRYSW